MPGRRILARGSVFDRPTEGAHMEIGERVEVYSAFEQTWTDGFEIADVRDEGYVVRRRFDGFVFPHPTSPTDLRSAPPPHPPVRR